MPGGLSTLGTSTLAFTPIQGIELVDPAAAAKKVEEANRRYFSLDFSAKKDK